MSFVFYCILNLEYPLSKVLLQLCQRTGVSWKGCVSGDHHMVVDSWSVIKSLAEVKPRWRYDSTSAKGVYITYRIVLIFCGSLISRIWNRSRNLFNENLSHCAVTPMGNTNSRNLFNEFLQSSYSRKFRPAKYKRYAVYVGM